ncbi:MAG TPA: MraY family glycosyltransferase [Rhodanobacteraceae bacterium]|nr:MraY family glycosyltransferase [Rhodanobacteraceae bacterium]
MIAAVHTVWSACGVSILASALSLCVLVPASRPIGLLDYPDARKRHLFATPLVGGLSIFIGILAGWLWFGRASRFDETVLATACVLVVLGALDDRYGLRVSVRVAVQTTAILIVIAATGMYVHSLGMLAGHDLTLGWLGIPFTVIAVIGLINAFNLMDGIDGLAGCLALVSTDAIALLGSSRVLTPRNVIVLLLAAALYPYLLANLGLLGRKAKVFLGDAGSVVLGYVIAWALIALSQSTPRRISPGLVLWCVGLPVIDTLAVMFRRLKRGVSPFTADRTHIHHLLMNAGIGPRKALACLVAFAVLLPCIGVAIRRGFGPAANLVAFVCVLAAWGWFTARLERRQAERTADAAERALNLAPTVGTGREPTAPPPVRAAGARTDRHLALRSLDVHLRGDGQPPH